MTVLLKRIPFAARIFSYIRPNPIFYRPSSTGVAVLFQSLPRTIYRDIEMEPFGYLYGRYLALARPTLYVADVR